MSIKNYHKYPISYLDNIYIGEINHILLNYFLHCTSYWLVCVYMQEDF